ncbi:MAG: copper-binding protein [Pseudomonadota bacterium]|nr:copper-binding protein [Pseudomonadota bacterium]
MNGPAAANPSAGMQPISFDLGSSAGHIAAPPETSFMGGGHEMQHAAPAGGMQMVHEGHVHAQASGTVNSVDTAARKINISHGPIQDLGWPAMTMDFPVAPSVNLKSIKPSARVDFTLEKGDDGMPVIQSVSPAEKGGSRS